MSGGDGVGVMANALQLWYEGNRIHWQFGLSLRW